VAWLAGLFAGLAALLFASDRLNARATAGVPGTVTDKARAEGTRQ
jgi:hypothetical protein